MEIKKFGETESEREATKMFMCRQIVQEVLKFGVTESQIKQIIKLLALEMEDRALMLKITQAISPEESESDDAPVIPTAKIIT